MNAMQRVISGYRLSDQELAHCLSNEADCKVMELWIMDHPILCAVSPMLSDLKHRITKIPFQMPCEQMAFCIESKILAGKIDELIGDIKKSPETLIKQIDLIKTHLKLGTLKPLHLVELLPLLLDHVSTKDIAAILQSPPIPSSLSPAQLLRVSSIFPSTKPCPAYLQIVQNKKSLDHDIQAIRNLEGLTDEEKECAIAYYIEKHRISLVEVKNELSDEACLRLAPYLRYVNMKSFPNIELARNFLKNCPHPNTLLIDNEQILEGIAELPHCQMLDCNGCTALKELPALPHCQSLYCNGCTALKKLPELPLCQMLSCQGCTALLELPPLPLCQTLYCHECTALSALPPLPVCQILYCYKCTALKELPALPICLMVYCYGCTALQKLCALPLCEKLHCYQCTALSALPPLPLCKDLKCQNCTALSTLPLLPHCQTLYCYECTALEELPALPLCQELFCYDCTALSSVPPLPRCRELNCSKCPLLELPALPWDAHVVTGDEDSDALPFTSLNVDIEKFTEEPVSLLLQLGEYLLQNKPFPNIYYFEKGERNVAVDFGGVRRDFVTKLCFNLFKEQGLKLNDYFPMAVSDSEEEAYRSLGCLFVQCYPAASFYKTGPLFDPGVYQCMLIPNPGTDEWFLTNYLNLVKAPAQAGQLIDLNQAAPQLPESDLTKIAYLVDTAIEETAHYNQNYFNERHNRVALRGSLLIKARQDERLKAISWMAQEMRKKVDLKGNLQDRIEGVLNKEALKRKIAWDIGDSRFLKTQAYVLNWIDHHDQLEEFVYAVTGNRTLCANPIIVQIIDRDKNFIPVAHTCSFTLEISANYESQEVFDQKIRYFLEHALANSGFSMI